MNDKNDTLSVKIPKWVKDQLNIIAQTREHGTNANDLLKKCLQFIIEAAKISGPISPEFQSLLDMLRLDTSWHGAFNFADVTAQTEVAQVILVLQQSDGKKPREGFGLAMINKPFLPGETPTMTLCVDEILERVVSVSMKGLYQHLRDLGSRMDTQSLRETLTTLCDAQQLIEIERDFRAEMPAEGNYHDFGAQMAYGQRTKIKQHRTIDGVANRQQRIKFNDDDREQADEEARDD